MRRLSPDALRLAAAGAGACGAAGRRLLSCSPNAMSYNGPEPAVQSGGADRAGDARADVHHGGQRP